MTDQEITPTQTLEREFAGMEPVEGVEASVLTEAVKVIDTALAQMMQRELTSTSEVADLLLDLRSLLTAK